MIKDPGKKNDASLFYMVVGFIVLLWVCNIAFGLVGAKQSKPYCEDYQHIVVVNGNSIGCR